MLQNKKNLLSVVLCFFVLGSMFAQTSASLSQRYLQKADDEYSSMQYEEAFKTINACLRMYPSKEEVSGPTYLLAKQIYAKLLDKMTKTRDFTLYNDVIMNLQAYPLINDEQVQKYVRMIQQIQSDMKDEAAAAKNREMMENLSAKQQAGNEEILKSINKSNEDMVNSISDKMNQSNADLVKGVTTTMNATVKEMNQTSSKNILIIVILGTVLFLVVCILVILGMRASARASAIQSEQLDSTLKLIAGMQQTNNQLLLGGITDFGGMGLKSAGSSRWGVDALPAPEMTDEEKAELKQLVIDCERLGSEIDATTKRKNKSKNVSELVYKLAMQLGLNQNSSMIYFAAAMVYDAGLLALPQDLLESENLDENQRAQLRDHVNLYEQYLGFVPRKYWNIFEESAKYHTENVDGSGYHGLKGEEIPQIARLIHVAESYVSLISRRNYKQIQDKESAIQELESKPNLYDSDVVKVLDAIV